MSLIAQAMRESLKTLAPLSIGLLLTALPHGAQASLYRCQNVFFHEAQILDGNKETGLRWDGSNWSVVKKSRWLGQIGIQHFSRIRDYQSRVDIATKIILEELARREIRFEIHPDEVLKVHNKSNWRGAEREITVSRIRISPYGDHWINRLARRYSSKYSAKIVIDPFLATGLTRADGYANFNPITAFVPFQEVIDPLRFSTRNLSHELAHVRRMSDRFEDILQLLKDPYFIPALTFKTTHGPLIDEDYSESFKLDEIPGYLMSLRIQFSLRDLRTLQGFVSFFLKKEPLMFAALKENLKAWSEPDSDASTEQAEPASTQAPANPASKLPTRFTFRTSISREVTVEFPKALLKPTNDLEERRADMLELLTITSRIVHRTKEILDGPEFK